jgi:hypothetical protein
VLLRAAGGAGFGAAFFSPKRRGRPLIYSQTGTHSKFKRSTGRWLKTSRSRTPTKSSHWNAAPIVLLYRQSVELQLKTLVGEGSNFLKSPTDHITLAKTHSLRWLAQIVCQIIRAVKWEKEFKREGISSLAAFSALVDELESLDPVAVAIRPGNRRSDFSVPDQLQPPKVVRFAKRLDALLDLLAATADGLAAEWDLQRDGISTESCSAERAPELPQTP